MEDESKLMGSEEADPPKDAQEEAPGRVEVASVIQIVEYTLPKGEPADESGKG
jgi:hypothetical protein